MAVLDDAQKSAEELVQLSFDELELELGRRLKVNSDEAAKQPELTMAIAQAPAIDAAELAGPRDFLRNLGKAFFNRFNRQLYSLVCNPDDPDHETVKNAVAGGAEKVALVVSGILIAQFAWLPAIASVLAAIVAKRAVLAGHQSVCDAWEKEIKP